MKSFILLISLLICNLVFSQEKIVLYYSTTTHEHRKSVLDFELDTIMPVNGSIVIEPDYILFKDDGFDAVFFKIFSFRGVGDENTFRCVLNNEPIKITFPKKENIVIFEFDYIEEYKIFYKRIIFKLI